MATKRVFLGNVKGPKGDAYMLTDDDRSAIVEELKEFMFPEVWRFVDDKGNAVDKVVYVRADSANAVTFTLDDGSTVTKGVDI